MRRETIQRVATPTALLVGVADDLAMPLIDTLSDAGLRVLKVGHAAAAAERIPVIMPQLVIVGGALHPAEHEMLTDRCVAVGAEVVMAPATKTDPKSFLQAIRATAYASREKFLRARVGER